MNTRKCVCDIQTAIDLYYQTDRLRNTDIMRLFSCGRSTAQKLKKAAQEQEEYDGLISPSSTTVNTAAAYKAWGLNIKDMVRRYKQYQNLQKGIQT